MAAHPFDPFSHSLQAEAVVPACGIEAAAVVAQMQANLLVAKAIGIPSQIAVIRHTEKLDLIVTPEELAQNYERN